MQNLESVGAKKSKYWEIPFKAVQMMFLAMHITDKIKFLYIYGRTFTEYLHGTWSLLNILMIFAIKEKFDPYNVFLAIATNIPQWLKTGFVVQGHNFKAYQSVLMQVTFEKNCPFVGQSIIHQDELTC